MQTLAKEDLLQVLKDTTLLWEKVRDKSIFLTGGTGFFGKWLLESFVYINECLSLNATITILSRNPDAFLDLHPQYKTQSSVRWVKGDIQTFEFPSGPFQFVIHAATDADAKLNVENPLLMLDTITGGTKRVLEFTRHQPCESYLLASSGAVYGKQPESVTHIKEGDSFFIDLSNTSSAYAEGKRVAELYSSIYYTHFAVPVKIARCFAFVGPYLPLDKHFAIGNFISNALKGEDIVIKGDGTPFRSYLYGADLAIWLWTILLNGKNNVGYNVGSDTEITIADTAKAVAAVFGNSIKVKIIGKPTNKPVERYVPGVEKAKNELGLKVNFDINTAIRKTKQFYE